MLVDSAVGVTRFAYPHMTTKCTLLETCEWNTVQLPFRVTEFITSKTHRMNKSAFKQNKNILLNGSFAKCFSEEI